MLQITKGWAAPETIEAMDHAALLAERSGNLTQLVNWMASRCLTVFFSGDFPAVVSLADQALELSVRQGSSANLAFVHALQVLARHQLSDLDGAERHFEAGLKYTFFERRCFQTGSHGRRDRNLWNCQLERVDARPTRPCS